MSKLNKFINSSKLFEELLPIAYAELTDYEFEELKMVLFKQCKSRADRDALKEIVQALKDENHAVLNLLIYG